jgi:hypothetical protein
MILVPPSYKSSITLYVSLMVFNFVSCKGSVEDPFISPKVGTVSESHGVASLSGAAAAKIIVLLRVGQVGETVIQTAGVARLKEGPPLSWQSLTINIADRPSVKRLYSELKSGSYCVDNEPDIKELLSLYPSMIAICDKDVISAFEKASSLAVGTKDNGEQSFSSWGINLSEIGASTVMIYTVFL